jgi:uncharacterized membrane protein (UPF0136 family)
MPEQKPDETRGSVALIFIIVIGLIIGYFIKRVQVGLIIGLALGLLGSGLWRRRN